MLARKHLQAVEAPKFWTGSQIRSITENMSLFRSSYYDKDYRAGAALLRARRPYLVKNMLTGALLCGFCIGVYSFTINAVGQDDFSDVKVPEVARSTKAEEGKI